MFTYSGCNFSYAETIAHKMRTVYKNSGDIEHKKLALQNILIASVLCNRWAAMDVFDEILANITETSEAMAIAEMLTENMNHYGVLADRLQRKDLHPAIQAVRSDALGEEFEKSSEFEIDLP